LENGEVDGIHPKVATLMIGTNNVRDNSAEEIAEGIKAIVKTLRAKLPQTKVLLLGVFPRGEQPDDPSRAKLAAVNETIAARADEAQTGSRRPHRHPPPRGRPPPARALAAPRDGGPAAVLGAADRAGGRRDRVDGPGHRPLAGPVDLRPGVDGPGAGQDAGR